MKLLQKFFQSALRGLTRVFSRQPLVVIVNIYRAPLRQRVPKFSAVRLSAVEAAIYGQLSLL